MNKIFVSAFFTFCILFSIISTSGNNLLINDSKTNEIIMDDLIGYFGIGNTVDCWLYEFELNAPGDKTCTCNEGFVTFVKSGSWTNYGNIIAFLTYNGNSGFVEIDPISCNVNFICDTTRNFNSLAYDHINDILYGSSDNNYLYKMDLETCEQEQIGPFGGGVLYMIGMSFDSEGVLYGWDLGNDALWTIDTETGEATQVGHLGISINYGGDGHFCFENDILYISANTGVGMCLYECDEDTGACSFIGCFGEDTYSNLLAIPYECIDTTPPKTTISFNPPEPNGCNGWYTSNINVTLNATDDISGVREIHYKVADAEWEIFYGNSIVITLDYDCLEDGLIEYYAVDFENNVEDTNSFCCIDIDQIPPDLSLTYEVLGWSPFKGWEFQFTGNGMDNCSGMDRVEFYFNNELQETVSGSGPEYVWTLFYFPIHGAIFRVTAWDQACNFASLEVKGSDISSHFKSNSITRYSNNIWVKWFLYRFQNLEVFLREMTF
ncbi:MAG: hypothetical protein AYK22_05580 [Thermoplasmatales archaeon SG8-52-3]|nr:MAG: hypothetical protein AYK22_05580 [Thermoplasmatales archaeon SG8-52-3]